MWSAKNTMPTTLTTESRPDRRSARRTASRAPRSAMPLHQPTRLVGRRPALREPHTKAVLPTRLENRNHHGPMAAAHTMSQAHTARVAIIAHEPLPTMMIHTAKRKPVHMERHIIQHLPIDIQPALRPRPLVLNPQRGPILTLALAIDIPKTQTRLQEGLI